MRRSYPILSAALLLVASLPGSLGAQDDHRGRKYTPPPPVGHITVTVLKGLNNKPVENAAVVFHTMHEGKDQGNLEVKTNEEGRAVIDVIPIGDEVRLQVIKTGFQTYGEDFQLAEGGKAVVVKLHAPTRQYSSYDAPAAAPTGEAPSTPEPPPPAPPK